MKKDNVGLARTLSAPVSHLSRMRGETSFSGRVIALELELEGRNVAMEGRAVKGWEQHRDGSLRGESIEYVFNGPCERKEAEERVHRLFELFNKNNVMIKNSYRCSTHVHMNMSDATVKELLMFFFVYTVVEELLEVYCGDTREGNLHCLSARDAEGQINRLVMCIEHGDFGHFNGDYRYSAFNFCSINKFGSVELRTMAGAQSAEEVLEWINILFRIYEYSQTLRRPPQLMEELSGFGPEGFVERVFGVDLSRKILDKFNGGLYKSLFEGARLIQPLCYDYEDAWAIPVDVKELKKKKSNRFGQARELEGRIARVDRNGAIIGRVLMVPLDPEDEDVCPGVPTVWYNAEEGRWFDDEIGIYLDFV